MIHLPQLHPTLSIAWRIFNIHWSFRNWLWSCVQMTCCHYTNSSRIKPRLLFILNLY